MEAATARATEEAYSGFLGAYRYAYRAADSRVLRWYVVASGLVGAAIAFLLVLAVVVWFTRTLGQSALVTTANAFLGVVAIFVLGPLVAPVLLVARRHRLGAPANPRYDRWLGVLGFAYLTSLYVGLVVSVPPEFQTQTSNPVVLFLYGLPALLGVVPPLVVAVLVWVAHRTLGGRTRNREGP